MKSGSSVASTQSRRDILAAALLIFATAAFVFWQNSQVAILWDLSYLLDTSWRIALGQMPYRDFPLVHAPLTFLVQAAIMRLAGRHYFLQIVYAALIGGLGSVIGWRIIFRVLQERVHSAWAISLMLAAPLVFLGVYSIYPHPIYDCDCAFAILVAILMLQPLSADEARRNGLWSQWARPTLTGVAVALPVFFKQNMGLPFLLAVVVGLVLLLVIRKFRKTASADTPSASTLAKVLAGIAIAMLAALTLIQLTASLDSYLQWTVRFAASRRLPGFAEMLAVYRQPSFAWTLPCVGCGVFLLLAPFARRLWARALAFCLLSAPFIGGLVFLFLDDDLDERADNLLALWPMLLLLAAILALAELRKGVTLARLMPFFILAAIHGTLLSQQLWGSTYAIWPLLMVLIAEMIAYFPASFGRLALSLAAVVSVTFLVCGGLYSAGHDRLNYAYIFDGQIQKATLPPLRGMAVRGPYLPDFEELIHFADREIPPADGILLLPGEEPFYFATGRTPQFPVQIFDQTTDPYSPQGLLAQARERNIRWVIVKTRLQSTEDPLPDREQTMALVAGEFSLYKNLSGYDIYRRR